MTISLTDRNIEELTDNLKKFGFDIPDDFSNDSMQLLVEIILDTLEIKINESD